MQKMKIRNYFSNLKRAQNAQWNGIEIEKSRHELLCNFQHFNFNWIDFHSDWTVFYVAPHAFTLPPVRLNAIFFCKMFDKNVQHKTKLKMKMKTFKKKEKNERENPLQLQLFISQWRSGRQNNSECDALNRQRTGNENIYIFFFKMCSI